MSDPFPEAAPPPGSRTARNTPIGDAPGFAAPPPAPPGYGRPPVGQPQWAQPPQQPPPQQQGTNGLAIAAFVLGLLWICTLGSILGIVFGFVALGQIKRSNQGGRGLAIAGIVLGIIGLVLTTLFFIVVWDKAEDAIEMESGERDDVEIAECQFNAGGDAEAVLEITNDSSRPSAYIITMTFRAGGESVETGVSGVDVVEAGATQTRTVTASGDLPAGGDLVCDVTYVNRFASGGNEDE